MKSFVFSSIALSLISVCLSAQTPKDQKRLTSDPKKNQKDLQSLPQQFQELYRSLHAQWQKLRKSEKPGEKDRAKAIRSALTSIRVSGLSAQLKKLAAARDKLAFEDKLQWLKDCAKIEQSLLKVIGQLLLPGEGRAAENKGTAEMLALATQMQQKQKRIGQLLARAATKELKELKEVATMQQEQTFQAFLPRCMASRSGPILAEVLTQLHQDAILLAGRVAKGEVNRVTMLVSRDIEETLEEYAAYLTVLRKRNGFKATASGSDRLFPTFVQQLYKMHTILRKRSEHLSAFGTQP